MGFVISFGGQRAQVDADLDLTPPEERIAKRRRRNVLLAIALAIALIVGGLFAGPPLRRAIKGWQARRTAREALALVDRGEWSAAVQKARDAQILSFNEPETWRAIARLLSRTNQAVAAVEWWKKLDAAGKLTVADRREFAVAALSADDLGDAARQVDFLTGNGIHPTTADILLAAQLAACRRDGEHALDFATRVWNDPAAQPNEILSAAILTLSFTKSGSPPQVEALAQIAKLARDPANPISLEALKFLARQHLSGGALPADLAASDIASALERHPKAQPADILLAFSIRAHDEPARIDELVMQAIQRFGGGDDDTLAALASWLLTAHRYDDVLQVVPLNRAGRRRDLALHHLDALAGLGRWDDVKNALADERLRLPGFLQHMYLATAREKLGETVGATNEWQRALAAADTPDTFLALAGYAEQNGRLEVAQSAFNHVIKAAPRTRAAYVGALRMARQRDETAEAQKVTAAMLAQWPEDVTTRRQDMYLRLLLGASGADAEAAEAEAQSFVKQEPANWEARAMLALARLRLRRAAAALEAFSGLRATGAEPPASLAIRAAALDANGWKEGAQNDARNLAAARLLPEERALIAPLTAAQP